MHLGLFERARGFGDRMALVSEGTSYSYAALLDASEKIATSLLNGCEDLKEARIAFLVAPSFAYTATQWGIWMAGGIAVPLCELHPLPSMEYVLEDTRAELLIAGSGYEDFLSPLEGKCKIPIRPLGQFLNADTAGVLPTLDPERRAMILYT
ncbi:MAG: AMP-binding protein, partial [Eudoraea sp.]|nr:AMP-binding protein [Eudoraea sp.]